MTADTTLAYLAGFFDGEGSIGVPMNPQRGHQSYYLRISAPQVDPAPLRLLQETFGGYVYARTRPERADGYDRQRISEWVLTGPAAARALAAMLPYLVVKARRAAMAVWFQASKRANQGPGSRRKLTGWELAERQSFAEALAVRTNHQRVGGATTADETAVGR